MIEGVKNHDAKQQCNKQSNRDNDQETVDHLCALVFALIDDSSASAALYPARNDGLCSDPLSFDPYKNDLYPRAYSSRLVLARAARNWLADGSLRLAMKLTPTK